MDTNEEPFDVLLQKSYGHHSGQRTFTGTITVTATSQSEAEAKVRAMLFDRSKPLQTTDPRIVWEEGCDPEELADEGWEYEDWSFGLVEQ